MSTNNPTKKQQKPPFNALDWLKQNNLQLDKTFIDLLTNNTRRDSIINHLRTTYPPLTIMNAGLVLDVFKVKYNKMLSQNRATYQNQQRQLVMRSIYNRTKSPSNTISTGVSKDTIFPNYLADMLNMKDSTHFKGHVDILEDLYYDEKNRTKRKAIAELAVIIEEEIPMFTVLDTNPAQIYYFNETSGLYTSHGRALIEKIGRNLFPTISTPYLYELVSYVRTNSQLVEYSELDQSPYRALKNGILDVENLKVLPFNKQYYLTKQLPVTFDPDADCPLFKSFLEQVIPDRDKRRILLEYFGFCLEFGYPLHNGLILEGGKDSGKDTTTNVIEKVFGGDNCSNVSPFDMAKDPRMAGGLYGKMVNIAGDLDDSIIKRPAILKKLMGDTTLQLDVKYGIKNLQFKNEAKLIYTTNKLPQIWDDSGATQAKFLLIHYPGYFGDKPDTELTQKLTTEEEKSGILNLIITNLEELRKRKRFRLQKVKKEESVMEWYRTEDTVAYFLEKDENIRFKDKIPRGALYLIYTFFCQMNNLTPVTQKAFGRKINKLLKDVSLTTMRFNGTTHHAYENLSYKDWEKEIAEINRVYKQLGGET